MEKGSGVTRCSHHESPDGIAVDTPERSKGPSNPRQSRATEKIDVWTRFDSNKISEDDHVRWELILKCGTRRLLRPMHEDASKTEKEHRKFAQKKGSEQRVVPHEFTNDLLGEKLLGHLLSHLRLHFACLL